MSSSNAPTKKRAGRPLKNENTADLAAIEGIVTRPSDDTHLAELYITRPTIFKKLLSLYNDYDANEIMMTFTKTHLSMRAYKEDSKMVIETIIEGSNCNRYYCAKEIQMYVECEALLRLNSSIEPEYDYDFEMSVKPDSDKKSLTMYLNNKNTKQQEQFTASEIKTQNNGYGPIFNSIEQSWPIAFEGISKSFKRKFTGIIKNYRSDVRFINDPHANDINVFAQTVHLGASYELVIKALVTEHNKNSPEVLVNINIKPLKLFLKNAVDETTQFFINEEKVVCLTAKLGKVKNKGSVIGITKFYYWDVRSSIEKYLPPEDLLVLRVIDDAEDDDEPNRKKAVEEKRAKKTRAKSTRSTKKRVVEAENESKKKKAKPKKKTEEDSD